MRRGPANQRGVAIALVVWFIAGMSLLVAGIVSHARVDSRMTQVHLARAKAVAAGDGAITLAMAERQRGYQSSGRGPLISESSHQMGDVTVTVRLYPADGFIDVNVASKEVLAALFSLGAGLERAEALSLADSVVKWRNPGGSGREVRLRRREFHALEDLMRVEGMSRSTLDAVRDYVIAGGWAKGSMNWSASPQVVLKLLESMDPARAESVMGRRDNLVRTGGNNRGQSSSGTADGGSVFRADALVAYGGKTWLRRRWLVRGSAARSALPWKVVRTEQPRVIQG